MSSTLPRALGCALVIVLVASGAEARRAKRSKRPHKPAPVATDPVEATDAAPAPAPPVCPEPTPAPEAPSSVRVMLLDLRSSGGLTGVARVLGQVVAEEAAKVKGFELLSSEEVRAVLDQEAQKALMGCDESGCLAELADAMDATLLVSGQLEQAPAGAKVITLSLLNTRALVTVNRVSLAWAGDEQRLPDLARAATQLLVFEKDKRPPAALVVDGLPQGGRVLVDGEDRSADAGRGSIEGLEVGIHEVSLSAPGFAPRTEQVLLVAGQSARVDAGLVEVPVTDNWWFWSGAGAAVLTGVGVTAAVLVLTGPADVTVAGQIPALSVGDVERVKGGHR